MRIYGNILVNVDYRIFFFFFAVSFSCTFGLFTSFLPSSICRSICRAVKASLNQFAQVPMPVFLFIYFFFFCPPAKTKRVSSSLYHFFYQDADPTKLERREITTYASLAGVPKPTKNCRLLRKSNVVKSRRFIFFSKNFFFLTRPFELAEGIDIII